MSFWNVSNKDLKAWVAASKQRQKNYVNSELMQRHQEMLRALEAMLK